MAAALENEHTGKRGAARLHFRPPEQSKGSRVYTLTSLSGQHGSPAPPPSTGPVSVETAWRVTITRAAESGPGLQQSAFQLWDRGAYLNAALKALWLPHCGELIGGLPKYVIFFLQGRYGH